MMGAVGVGLLIALAVIWVFQRRLIYYPMDAAVPPSSTVLGEAEDVTLVTEDGLQLGAWFVVPAGGGRAGTVLVFNGNGGDRSLRAPLAAELARAGLAVLLFDYRGYARNPGQPSEQGLLNDARAARAYLSTRADVDADEVFYFGESLGAAVALQLALEHPPKGLVLRSPFTSLADMGRVHYPFLPSGPLLRDRFESISHAQRVTCPVLVIAGDRDQIVPPEQSIRLYEAIRAPKRLVLVPRADHNDYDLLAGAQLVQEVVAFTR